MSVLCDLVNRLNKEIEKKGLPLYQTRGKIAIQTGIVLTLVTTKSPDDPQQIAALKKAAKELFGINL